MKTNKTTIKWAILLLSLLQMSALLITSALMDIAKAFPKTGITTIQLLATYPSLIIIPVSLMTGKLTQYFGKKRLAQLSSVLLLIEGIGGYFLHSSIWILYVWATFTGVAIGILIPVASTLIADNFSGDEKSKFLGIQSTAISGGGIILNLLGGFLSQIHWNYSYLAYLLIIPGLIMVSIGLPNDEKKIEENGSGKVKLNVPVVAFYSIIAFLFITFFSVLPTNIAMFLQERNLGQAAEAGIASAIMLTGSAAAGIFFGFLESKFGEKIFVLSFFCLSAGLFVIQFSSILPIVFLGTFLSGLSLTMVMVQCTLSISNKVKPEAVSMSLAIMIALNNCGAFISPVFTGLSKIIMKNELVSSRFLLISILAFVTSISLLFVLQIRKGKKTAQ